MSLEPHALQRAEPPRLLMEGPERAGQGSGETLLYSVFWGPRLRPPVMLSSPRALESTGFSASTGSRRRRVEITWKGFPNQSCKWPTSLLPTPCGQGG